ncbi:hypothetical protein LEM8419_03292 [Neolewinella maritima]|uniref:Uncharacterized protein n=1 Tax=Neolewinella maritima TaxID=1383882 RepID=A0ABM9B525_9BACT|nr:hypothetical protein [Neolewinella maritima]CAH1002398.1 hypothetical protein LEM8419_03292 [Neolewinella maritima]
MKTLLFVCLLCAAAVSANPAPQQGVAAPTAKAAVEPLITRTMVVDQQLGIVLANLERVRTRVSITRMGSGEAIFQKHIKRHNGYSAMLNLKHLDDGRYVITVKKGDVVRKQVVLKDGDLLMCSDWA